MKKLLLFLLINGLVTHSHAQTTTITGNVFAAENMQPLSGATLTVLPGGRTTITNQSGSFSLIIQKKDTLLVISFIGYITQSLPLPQGGYRILLQSNAASLENVTVSTGYDKRTKLNSTGAFSVVNNELLTRQVTTNVLQGLDGVTSSVQFEKRPISNPFLSIRGRSTIMGNSKPLIVLDGFPYEGDLDNLNPNNIESVTILKDAAASAVWGVRASNGVIVITSKKGRYNQSLKMDVSTAYSITEKPRLFDVPVITTGDFIDVEQFLFSKGFYNSQESSTSKPVLSPVVEILIKKRDGLLTAAQAQEQIDALRKFDVRNDIMKYWYHPATSQQYAVNLRGGSNNMYYAFSAGYNKNISTLDDHYDRFVIRSDNAFILAKGLELNAGITLTESQSLAGKPDYNSAAFSTAPGKYLYPYTRLADDDGNALPISKDYRASFAEAAPAKGLLNWQYTPLDEAKLIDKKTKQQDVLLITGISYNFLQSFTAELQYQYERAASETKNNQGIGSYFTRNEINRFTQFNTSGAIIGRPVPLGGILDVNNAFLNAYTLRTQLRYARSWKEHNINILIGAEQRESYSYDKSYRLYGYNDNVLTSIAVNFDSTYRLYIPPTGTAKINNGVAMSDITNRYRSQYITANYSYRNRYLLSASARKDGSNLFGVNANQKTVPLWSAGAGWLLSRENFYNSSWLPFIKLRLIYGYNGNIDNTLSAFTVLNLLNNNVNGQPYANLRSPANANLRWEKMRMINTGIDFSLKKEVITGNIDVWWKKGKDLIGLGQLDPTTGVWLLAATSSFSYKSNLADMKGFGFDIELQTKNINTAFHWTTNFLFSYATDKVTRYANESTTTSAYLSSLGINPVIGKPVYSVYSYQWGGLDSTGNPQGFVQGKLSKDYASIAFLTKPSELIYHGRAVAPFFGSIRNSFNYKAITLSANLTYRFGYWYRRNSINYSLLFNNYNGHGDFSKRWQKPGDEAFTNVPAMIYPVVNNRENFYLNSEVTVFKGDHIRLADVRLDYDLYRSKLKWLPFQQVKLFLYAANLGFVWRAEKTDTDPDTQSTMPIQKQYSFGMKVNL
jgi:TonB-dependent starch-binding outer membrane protein SusC